ncbi:hypothetical protein K488DRAFT_12446, partial [Vararia minispora EC-137]
IELKSQDSEDIFDDEDGAVLGNETARSTLGQIATYAMCQSWAQLRTHIFSILSFPREARLLRWDHSGVIVSERFVWKNGEELSDFLWRYVNLTSAQRGHDPTASLATEAEISVESEAMRAAG